MAWLPGLSVMVEPTRSDMAPWAGGGIIRSSPATRYQFGLIRQAASLIVPPSAFTPQGTWESAMNAACPAGRSPANEAGNLSRSRNRKPSLGAGSAGDGYVVLQGQGRVLHDGDAVAVLRQQVVHCLPGVSRMRACPW
jgi:hypothetical protein